jgi:hypothetical protein
MKYYSIVRVETHGIEEFEWSARRGRDTACHVYADGSGNTERIGSDCFRSRKQAVKAAREKLNREIELCDALRACLQTRLRGMEKG